MKSLIISSWLKGEEGDKGLGKFVCWYLADLGSHTAARTYDGPGVAPDHCPTLDLQTGGHLLSPVQQIMDDRHSLPFDGVEETVAATVVLHRGIAPGPDESAGDVIVAVLAAHQEGSSVVLVHYVHLALRVAEEQVHDVLPFVGHGLEQSILSVLALIVDVDGGMLEEFLHGGHVPVPDGERQGCCSVVSCQIYIHVASPEEKFDQVRSANNNQSGLAKTSSLPLRGGSDEGRVAVQSSHVHQNVRPSQEKMDDGCVILLDGEDERGVTVGVGDVRVGVRPGQQLLHPVYPPTEGRHQEGRAVRVVLRLEQGQEGGRPLLPHLTSSAPWGTWGTLWVGQAGEQSGGAGGILVSWQAATSGHRRG